MASFARTVVESRIAEKVIDSEIKQRPRLSDIYEAIKWRLARGPDVGYCVPRSNPSTYVVHSFHWHIGVAVVIAYLFDNDQVEILDVMVVQVD